MRPGKPLEGFKEDEITWDHVQAVRESMQQKPTPAKVSSSNLEVNVVTRTVPSILPRYQTRPSV